jgi:maltose alpha-D-glucosyltransferase/alpha-amylase
VRGFSERDGGYLPNYFYFQPSLNYGYANPDPGKKWQLPVTHPAVRAVRQELKNIMRFWLDMGADGFRVDMANSLVRGDANGRGLRALWLDYRSWLDRHYPEAVLISEWGDPRHSIASGFDIDFFLHFGEPAYQHLLGPANGDFKSRDKKRIFFNRRGTGNIRLFLDNYLPHYHATKRRGYIALPTGNHDFSRHSRWQEPEDLRIIYAMLFTMPGVPFILYGDEIGQKFLEGLGSKEGSYSRAGTRAPMQWEKARNFGFSTAAKNKLYLPVNPITDAHNVAAQERNPESLLNLTKRLLILRRQHPALGNCGNFTPVCAKAGKYPFVYERSYRQTRFWVAINPTEFTLRLKLPPLKSVMNLASEKADLARQKTNSTLTMDPLSFGIFKIG